MSRKTSPTISIVISAYNHGKYVGKTIKSLLSQTFADFEIIVIDNGSKDDTYDVLKSFTDPRIRFFRFEKNRGISRSLNFGIEKAEGKYIYFLGSDDILFPHALKMQFNYLEKHGNIGAIFSRVELIGEDGRTLDKNSHYYHKVFNQKNKTRYEWLKHFFYNGNCLCFSGACIKKTYIKTIGYNDPKLAQLHDFDLWVGLVLHSDIHIIQEPLIQFRIRSGNKNVSANTPKAQIRSMFEFGHVLKRFLKIKSTQEFLKIFPDERKKHKDISDNDLIPFYVARAALSVKHIFHQKFAIDTIYELLEDKKMVKKMESICHFSYPEFIKITGDHDLYHVQHIEYQENVIKELTRQLDNMKTVKSIMQYMLKKLSTRLKLLF